MISDRKAHAIRLELARLFVVSPLGVLAMVMSSSTVASNVITWLAVFGYALGSFIVLLLSTRPGAKVPTIVPTNTSPGGQGSRATH
jgi:hypothetical protein